MPDCGPYSEVEGLEVALTMAQRALVVRREALNALLDELASLRAENELLVSAIADPSLGVLRERLHYLEAELVEERSAREAVERELADTAEATYEMWDAFRDWMGSEGRSRAGTSVYSRDSSPDDDGRSPTGWRTPPPPRGATPGSQTSPGLPWQAGVGQDMSRGGAGLSPKDCAVRGSPGRPSPRPAHMISGNREGSVAVAMKESGGGDMAAMERRVMALAGKLQHKDVWRSKADVDTPRDKQRAGT